MGKKSGRKGQRGGAQAVKQANYSKRANEATETKGKGKKAVKGSQYPVAGLSNLGNTCFFNSVMQCLSRTHLLRTHLEQVVRGEEWRVELTSPRGQLPPLPLTVSSPAQPFTATLHQFLAAMATATEGGGTLNPKQVFEHVINKAPRFRSYQQQDSQELLRYLLDALRNEEVHRIKRAILEVYKVTGALKKTATQSLTEKDRKAIKEYGIAAAMADTFVERVFGGQLASSVTCSQCNTCSVTTEGFLDLSLSMPDTKPAVRGAVAMVTDDQPGWRKKKKDSPPKPSKHQLKQARKDQKKAKRMNKSNKMTNTQKQPEEEEGDSDHDHQLVSDEARNQHPREQEETECTNVNNTSHDHSATDNTDQHADRITVPDDSMSDSALVDSMASLSILPYCEQDSIIEPSHDQLSTDTQTKQIDLDPEDQDPQPKNAQESTDQEPQSTDQALQPDNPQSADLQPKSADKDPQSTDQDLQPENPQSADQDLQPNSTDQDPQSTDQDLQPQSEDAQPENKHEEAQSKDPLPPDPFSIEACLYSFCSMELLTGDDRFACQECTKNQQEGVKQQQQDGQEEKQEQEEDNRQQGEEDGQQMEDQRQGEEDGQQIEDQRQGEEDGQQIEDQRQGEEDGQQMEDQRQGEDGQQMEDQWQREEDGREQEGIEHETQQQETNDQEKGLDEDELQHHGQQEHEKIEQQQQSDNHDGQEQTTQSVEGEDQNDEDKGSTSISHSPAHSSEEQSIVFCDADTSKESDDLSSVSSTSQRSEQVKMVLCDATHQLLISRTPDVLCLHIKRFSQQGRSMRSLRKNSSHIDFPLYLDMTPYCTLSHQEQFTNRLMYSLYGVVEHSGNMHGGHYTAFICHQNTDGAPGREDQWYHISDSHVRTASVKELLKAQAYILFYQRIN